LKERLVLPVDIVNLFGEALLLKLVVFLVSFPDHCLLVIECLFLGFTLLLLSHLAGEKLTHLLLFFSLTLHAALILQASTHFLLHFILEKGLLFGPNALLLPTNNISGESVHEVLGASLAGAELTKTVSFLFVEHLTVFKLSLHIGTDILHTLVSSLKFVGFVLAEHLLKVLLLLTTLFLLKCALHLHFLLKTVNKLNLSSEFLLIILAFAEFLFLQLPIAAFFLLFDLLPLSI